MSNTATVAAPEETGSASKHLGLALLVICAAQLMVVLDSTIANIALPHIRDDLHISQGNLQWIVTGYALAFGGLLLLGGRLGDLYGRRRVFMMGLVLFAVASGLGGFAQNEAMLLSSRALQGVGAALAAPSALALITTNFPPGERRNRAFSIYAMLSGVGGAIGLLLGGWLTGIEIAGIHGWRLTFLINVPIGILAALAAPRVLGESETHKGELDVFGALTATLGLVSIVYGVEHGGVPDANGATHWGSAETIAFLIAGAVLLVAFFTIERRVKHPLLPLRILANRTRALSFLTMFIVPAAMFAMFYFLSQLIQNVMGYSPLMAGVAFMPFPFAMVFGAVLASKLVAKVDPRFLTGTGTLLAGSALFMFSRITVHDGAGNLVHVTGQLASGHKVWMGDSVNYWTQIFPFIAVMAFGMALVFIPMMLSSLHGIDQRDAGIGSGVLNTAQQLGGALGLAILSTVAVHAITTKAKDLGGSVHSLLANGPHPSGAASAKFADAGHAVIGQAAFIHGSTTAFLVGAFMMWAASAIVWMFLNVNHKELHVDDQPEGAVIA
ncbi:MAG TPA: MFS transporter [Marmoricola sp.]|nr:MFS transporter [Marmoricola sp.]